MAQVLDFYIWIAYCACVDELGYVASLHQLKHLLSAVLVSWLGLRGTQPHEGVLEKGTPLASSVQRL